MIVAVHSTLTHCDALGIMEFYFYSPYPLANHADKIPREKELHISEIKCLGSASTAFEAIMVCWRDLGLQVTNPWAGVLGDGGH